MLPTSSRSFLLDENTSRSLVSSAMGYQVEHVREVGLQSHSDDDVFAYAQAHSQTIITIDLDFSNIIEFAPPHFGIMVLRLSETTTTAELIEEVLNALTTLVDENFSDTLFIIEKGRVRIRR